MLPPFICRLILAARLRRGKEDPERIEEKMAIPSKPRPEGKLIWVHGASVGECKTAKILLDQIDLKDAHILMTSGTWSSGRLFSNEKNVTHQYLPMDCKPWAKAFLDYWQPDTVLWMESELWPSFLNEMKTRNLPAALINARMSARSEKRWRLFPKTIARLLESFSLILCADDNALQRYQRLAPYHKNIQRITNLKYAYTPPSHAATKPDHPVFVAASTHEGEDALCLQMHQLLRKELPDLQTIIVPRHPERSTLSLPRLSETPDALQTESCLITDVFGRMAEFYARAHIVFVGKSLCGHRGGHNPIEPALFDAALVSGPHVDNFDEIYTDFIQAGAVKIARREEDLYQTLLDAYHNRARLGQAARQIVRTKADTLKDELKLIQDFIG